MKNSKWYYTLGFLAALISTPFFIYFITLNSSNFEGAKAIAQIFLLPVVFVAFLLIWLGLHNLLKDRTRYYLYAKIIFLLLFLSSIAMFSTFSIKDNLARKRKILNSDFCQKKLNDEYNGIVIVARANYITIRKLDDDEYEEFTYHFKADYDAVKDYYVGQKIVKNKNEKKFSVTLQNGSVKQFNVPCYS